ncbi:MAG: hypothetical protein CMF39_06405 [Legionellaceae bacterium]|nr:hypothetical protein [Legionellaceae bacterium]|tara:strand:- start:64 stop:456 length:393 start_codon:yes stop_codon:yes gene_type:complete
MTDVNISNLEMALNTAYKKAITECSDIICDALQKGSNKLFGAAKEAFVKLPRGATYSLYQTLHLAHVELIAQALDVLNQMADEMSKDQVRGLDGDDVLGLELKIDAVKENLNNCLRSITNIMNMKSNEQP